MSKIRKSEEKTKGLVLTDLGINLNKEYSEFCLIIQGMTGGQHSDIDKILKKAGGKNQELKGKGKPEYIIRLKNEKKVLLIECKADITLQIKLGHFLTKL